MMIVNTAPYTFYIEDVALLASNYSAAIKHPFSPPLYRYPPPLAGDKKVIMEHSPGS